LRLREREREREREVGIQDFAFAREKEGGSCSWHLRFPTIARVGVLLRARTRTNSPGFVPIEANLAFVSSRFCVRERVCVRERERERESVCQQMFC